MLAHECGLTTRAREFYGLLKPLFMSVSMLCLIYD